MMLVSHPVRFFRDCLERPRTVAAPGSVLASYLLVVGVGTALVSSRTREGLQVLQNPIPAAVEVGLAFGSAIAGIATVFVLTTLALVMLDLAFSQSGRAGRLWELSAYAQYPQVLWAVSSLFIVAVWFHPLPLVLTQTELSDSAFVREAVERWQQQQAAGPLQRTLSLISAYAGLAAVALQCCALRVVSGFSLGGAWAAGVVLAGVFVVTPWAIQRF